MFKNLHLPLNMMLRQPGAMCRLHNGGVCTLRGLSGSLSYAQQQ